MGKMRYPADCEPGLIDGLYLRWNLTLFKTKSLWDNVTFPPGTGEVGDQYNQTMLDCCEAVVKAGGRLINYLPSAQSFEYVKKYIQEKSSIPDLVLNNMEIVSSDTDEFWTRDCGPFEMEVVQHKGLEVQRIIIDTLYRYDRPSDNTSAYYCAVAQNICHAPSLGQGIDFDGGYILTDGRGTAFVTDHIEIENIKPLFPGLVTPTLEQIREALIQTFELKEVVFLPSGYIPDDPGLSTSALGETYHIDFGLKFLTQTRVMIAQYPRDPDPSNPERTRRQKYGNEILDSWQSIFESRGYSVVRITNPPLLPSGSSNVVYAYANSQYCRNIFIMPTFTPADGPLDGFKEFNENAARIYQENMPFHTVIPISDPYLPKIAGSLHCCFKEILAMKPLTCGHQDQPYLKLKKSPLVVIGGIVETGVPVVEAFEGGAPIFSGIGSPPMAEYLPRVLTSYPAKLAGKLGLVAGTNEDSDFLIQSVEQNMYIPRPYSNLSFYFQDILNSSLTLYPSDIRYRNRILFGKETQYYRDSIEQAMLLRPDVLILRLGRNEDFGSEFSQISSYEELVNQLSQICREITRKQTKVIFMTQPNRTTIGDFYAKTLGFSGLIGYINSLPPATRNFFLRVYDVVNVGNSRLNSAIINTAAKYGFSVYDYSQVLYDLFNNPTTTIGEYTFTPGTAFEQLGFKAGYSIYDSRPVATTVGNEFFSEVIASGVYEFLQSLGVSSLKKSHCYKIPKKFDLSHSQQEARCFAPRWDKSTLPLAPDFLESKFPQNNR
jgi:agmatine/peptidylarginine deiminase